MNIDRFVTALTQKGVDITTDTEEVEHASRDASRIKSVPLCVVFPESAQQVSETNSVNRIHLRYISHVIQLGLYHYI